MPVVSRVAPLVDLLLLNLTLRLVIVVASPQVQKDYSKCIAGNAGKFGELFPSWFAIPCLECVCFSQAGKEKCRVQRVSCPPLKCTMFEAKYSNCCRVCKGCFFNGTSYKDRDEWNDIRSPCTKFTCREGIVSQYEEKCHTNNTSIAVEGSQPRSRSCCNRQKGVNSSSLETIEERPLKDDPCTVCKNLNGTSTCRVITCPVLPCILQESKDPSSCCRKCDETKSSSRFLPEKWCLINGINVEDGKWHKINSCTLCQCQNGTASCKISTCPKLTCKRENLVHIGNRCCPQCRDTSTCIFMGKTYSNGQQWYLKGCVVCNCRGGRNVCRRQTCDSLPTRCPVGQTLGFEVGSCCETCIEKRQSCTTYGDPHYQTFDGKFYSFQGNCKYIFARNSNRTFSVVVKNSARYTGRFSWTKSVQVKFGKIAVNLQQNLKVKVNGKRIRTPYLKYPTLDIRATKRYLNVYTNIGISVTWDGDSYLSVRVSRKYMNSMTGLCGNFNGDASDDLQLRTGSYGHPMAFASQWIVGNSKQCSNTFKSARLSQSRCRGWKLYYAHKVCSIFRDREIRKCYGKVNPLVYHQSCVYDVCECPLKARCECGAVKAYMAQCKRKLKTDFKWKNEELCDIRCTGGSRYSKCGPGCKLTCNNIYNRKPCYNRCVPGCHCSAGLVWHNNRCMLPSQCPVSGNYVK